MAKKNQVISSDHYEEIHKRLSKDTGASVHRWLLKTHGENISTRTLNRYKAKYINVEDKALKEVNRRLAEQEKEKKVKNQSEAENRKEKNIQNKADSIENNISNDNNIADATATQLIGLLDVGSNYPESVKKMRKDAEDPKSKTEWGDVAAEERKALDTYLKFIKVQGTNVEVNVDNHITDLSKIIKTDKIRERLDAKRKRRKSKS